VAAIPIRSELLVAFVGPVGVESARFHEAAKRRLEDFGYTPTLIQLSERLDDLRREGLLTTELKSAPEYERVLSHMAAGDELRGLDLPEAHGLLAAAAMATIAAKRTRNALGQTTPVPGTAWLISSLKNPAEVEVFRRAYGPGFFLIGLLATEVERQAALERRSMTEAQAHDLIRRDLEGDEKHGQQTRKTFELADAWVNDADRLCRVLDLIFGDPFQTPSDDEDGMALAYIAALRSSDLSRQVGAAIVSKTGEVLSTGRNEVPAPGGGQYSPPTGERPAARDYEVGVDSNVEERLRIQGEIADKVDTAVRCHFADLQALIDGQARATLEDKLGVVRDLVLKVLPSTSLRDITEYGRPVHAEMSALTSAGRAGVSVKGATLYCTTFPCHNCAKHIVAAGISRVVYVEPYPKSKAGHLHADAITLVGEAMDERLSSLTARVDSERTRFEPFLGVGPRRYVDLFSLRLGAGRPIKRKDDESGAVQPFHRSTATPRVPLATKTYLEYELQAAQLLEDATQMLKRRPSK
jgi:cytidine deaminase